MEKYSKSNLSNIENIFQNKTGVNITEKRNEKNRMSKGIDIAVGAVFCLIAVSLFSYNGFSDIDKEGNTSATLAESEQLELKVGKYYIDGDTEGYYLEVFSDKTIQLRGVDYLEYAWAGNSIEGLSKEEADKVTENVKNQAKEYEKRYKYKVYQSGIGTMIFTEWEEVDGQCFGSGYTLIDENTIRGGNSTFIYHNAITEVTTSILEISHEEYSYPIYMVKLRSENWVWPTERTSISRHASDHISIAGFFGDEIYSVYDGVVSETGNELQDGNYILVELNDGFVVKYYHLDEISVKKGERVRKGEVIAKMGSTGQSTGPNLGFAVYKDGIPVNPLDADKSVELQ